MRTVGVKGLSHRTQSTVQRLASDYVPSHRRSPLSVYQIKQLGDRGSTRAGTTIKPRPQFRRPIPRSPVLLTFNLITL